MLDLGNGSGGGFNFGGFGGMGGQDSGPNKQVLWESLIFLGLSYFTIFIILKIFVPFVYDFFYNLIGWLFFAIPLIIYFWRMQEYDSKNRLKYKAYCISFGVSVVGALAIKHNSVVVNEVQYVFNGVIPVQGILLSFGLVFIGLFLWDFKNFFTVIIAKVKKLLGIESAGGEGGEEFDESDGDSEPEEVQLNYPELRDTVKKIFIAKKRAYAEDDNLRTVPEIVPDNDSIIKGPVTLSARLKIPFGIKMDRLGVVLGDLGRILKKDCDLIEIKEGKKDYFGHWLQISFSEEDLSAMRKAKKGVFFDECFEKYSDSYKDDSWNILFGISPFNDALIYNVDDIVHLLVGGQTGSGKSVFLHNILLQLIKNNPPDKLQVVLVDPKLVTFGMYKGIPHLKYPIVTAEPKKFLNLIAELKKEYLRRQTMMDVMKVQKIAEFNKAVSENKQFEIMANLIIGKIKQVILKQPESTRDALMDKVLETLEISDLDELEFRLDEEDILRNVFELFQVDFVTQGLTTETAALKLVQQLKEIIAYKPVPRIMVFVDELADLVMDKEYGNEIMQSFANLAGVCRSAYINLVPCTQHPNSTVVPALLKANLPSAAALKVKMATQGDQYSRTIIGQDGAAKLIGSGDCLLLPNVGGISSAIRMQTPFANNDYINKTVKDLIEEFGLRDFEDDDELQASEGLNKIEDGEDENGADVSETIPVIESTMIDIAKELEGLDPRFYNQNIKSNVWMFPSSIRVLSFWKRNGYIHAAGTKIVNDYPRAKGKDVKQFIKYLVEANIFTPYQSNGKIKESELVTNPDKNLTTIKDIVIALDDFLRNYNKENRVV